MQELYYFLLDYKDIYPLKFWTMLAGLALFLVSAIFFVKGISASHKLPRQQRASSTNENGEQSTVLAGAVESAAAQSTTLAPPPAQPAVKKSPRPAVSRALAMFIMCVSLAGIGTAFYFRYEPEHFLDENTALSESEYTFGIDVSHYQGTINWDQVRKSHHPVKFVFIRATMGHNGKDGQFRRNWRSAKARGYVRGAYHYYRPNENSGAQFRNFAASVKLDSGDFVPVLDVEQPSKFGKDNLRQGVINWLRLAEKHYGVKPIVYTGRNFYKVYLKGYVNGYPLWIASYSGKHRLAGIDWTFHQFTEKVKVRGIRGTVDGNDFNGSYEDLGRLCVKF